MLSDCCVLVRSDRTAKKMLEASSGASSLASAFEPARQKVLPSLWQYGTVRAEYAGALKISERPVVGVESQRIVFIFVSPVAGRGRVRSGARRSGSSWSETDDQASSSAPHFNRAARSTRRGTDRAAGIDLCLSVTELRRGVGAALPLRHS